MAVFFKKFLYQGFISTETFEKGIYFFVCSSYNNTDKPLLLALVVCCGTGKVDRLKVEKSYRKATVRS